MRRRAAKIDDNQPQIVEALRAVGCFVQSMAPAGQGVPDLLVGSRGRWFVMEVKDGGKAQSKRKLTLDQARWLLEVRNRAPVHVVETVEQALNVITEVAQ
jgi:Holliday junction resolvase